jgi:hypothetical protein
MIHIAQGSVRQVDPLVRILDVVFWITAALLVGALAFLDEPGVIAVLMAVLVVCSGTIALYEFRLNPLGDTERGEWTGRQLFYALVFTITFFVAFLYILTVVF